MKLFQKILQTYKYVHFITLKNMIIFVRLLLIKIASSATKASLNA